MASAVPGKVADMPEWASRDEARAENYDFGLMRI